MKYNKLIAVVGVLYFVVASNIASAQTQHEYFKSVTRKVMNCLQKNDTAGIHSLFDEDKRYYEVKDGIKGDSNLIVSIVKKYGVHVLDSMSLEKGKNEENVVVVYPSGKLTI